MFCEALSIDVGLLRESPFPTALASLNRTPTEHSPSPHSAEPAAGGELLIRWSVLCSPPRWSLYVCSQSVTDRGSSSSNQSEVRPPNNPPCGVFPPVSPHLDTTPSNGGVNWRSRLPVRSGNQKRVDFGYCTRTNQTSVVRVYVSCAFTQYIRRSRSGLLTRLPGRGPVRTRSTVRHSIPCSVRGVGGIQYVEV